MLASDLFFALALTLIIVLTLTKLFAPHPPSFFFFNTLISTLHQRTHQVITSSLFFQLISIAR